MIVSLEMGYGHLRAALPLADAFGSPVELADSPPLAVMADTALWRTMRSFHKLLSRPGPFALLERPANALMDLVTEIPPLLDSRQGTAPDLAVRILDQVLAFGLGDNLVRALRRQGRGILTTFYGPALIADRAGIEPVFCVVTDADVQRVWVPPNPYRSRIHYFAPSPRVVRRLFAYGVPRERISLTGFPLPYEFSSEPGREALRHATARRIVRLDTEGSFVQLHRPMLEQLFGPLPLEERGRPIEIVFAVGGAGAQVDLTALFLERLRDHLVRDRIRLHLVAGTRKEVADAFLEQLERARLASAIGTQVSVLYAEDFSKYYRSFNRLLARSDVLWTKPSELSFYAGLGIPLVLTHPVGTHERYNRRWLREQGAGLKQRRPDHLPTWFDEWCADGTLAQAAFSAYIRIPRDGTLRIAEAVQQSLRTGEARASSSEPEAPGLQGCKID